VSQTLNAPNIAVHGSSKKVGSKQRLHKENKALDVIGKRIALVLPDLGGGGAERVTLTLADEFVARGIAVDIVLMRWKGAFLEQVPQTLRLVDLKAPQVRQVPLAFARYLRAETPDAVIANMWPLTTTCIIARALAGSKARILVCEHAPLSNMYRHWGWLHGFLLRRSIAAFHPFADVRAAVSSGVADDLAAMTGIDRTRFDVVYNPVAVRLPASGGEAAVGGAWQGWTGKRIIAVGTLKEQKNQALLFHAFARLLETVDARLMLLGDGPLRGTLEALACKLGLADKIFMPGFIADTSPFYLTADLFVLSSDYEGLPTVLIEALAYGLPAVSTDCPSGPAEILESGLWGRLTPVGDAQALAAAMAESLAAEHDCEALKRRAADFSPGRVAEQYLQLLFPKPIGGMSGRS
jgi:glycosyltransferase involved in cell wall biosynthesis